ncbi:MAG: glycosyltransferase family 2 protein [bacterium]
MDLENIGVVIPAFNAEKTIGPLITEIIKQGFKLEDIIVVDDGSFDRTGDIVESFGVIHITHKKNIGKGAALKHGFDVAREKCFERVLTLDADGQHRVSEINRFLQHKNEFDIIVGCRHDMQCMPILRRLVNRTTSLVVSLLAGSYLVDVQCGFRLIDLAIFKKFNLRTNNYQTESEMIVKAVRSKNRIGSMPITTVYNKERSYINPLVDTLRFIKMAAGFLWR